MPKPLPFARIAAALFSLAVFSGGCLPILGQVQTAVAPAVGPINETPSIPTPNATLLAISAMLTETSAAPTATPTPIVTPTITPTATATTPPLGSSDRPVPVGQRVAAEGAALTVLSTGTSDVVGTVKAEAGSAFLNLEVIVENSSSSDMDYTPLYFHLRDAVGTDYQPESKAMWPALQSGTLHPGEWVRGFITFNISAGKSGLRLSYSPQVSPGYSTDLWVDLSKTPVQAEVPETGPVATTEPLPGAGKRVETGGIALTITQVNAAQRIGTTKAGNGNVLVEIQATIENVSRTLTPYNPEYFMLKDADGYEYPAIVIPADTLLQAGSLKEKQKISGQVVFEAPARDTRLIVEYQPQVLGEDYPLIRMSIEVPAAK